MAAIAVGLIGAGKHGQRYAQHVVRDVPELRLVALARQDHARGREQARELGCRYHTAWRDLVEDASVDAVVAAVPPSLHPDIASAVARARKPLLIEKPLATTGAAACEVVHVLRTAGVPCLMAHTLRWNAVVAAIRERIPALGPLRAVLLNQRFEPSTLGWLDDPEVAGGGIILHTGVHSFDLVRWLTGREVARVSCRVARASTVRTEDNFLATLELVGSDALVALNGSRATVGRSGLIDVAGAEGQLVGDHALGWCFGVRGLERTPVPIPEALPTVREVLRDFARLLVHGEQPRTRLEDGARSVLVAEACYRSAAAGTAVDVAPLAV
jgi:predicted dehydrogenase